MTEFRGQIENAVGALSLRIEELGRAVTDARAQHTELHAHVGNNTENILYASRVPTSPDTVEANPRPETLNPELRNMGGTQAQKSRKDNGI